MIAVFENEATLAIQTKERLYEEQDKCQIEFESELTAADKEISDLRIKLFDALKNREGIRNKHVKNLNLLNQARDRLGLKKLQPRLLRGEATEASLEMTIGDLIDRANCGYSSDSWIYNEAEKFVRGWITHDKY